MLSQAITQDRIAHGYLFSGPRGVGKTSAARILALAANCQAEPKQRPCGQCPSCRAARSGSHPDIQEIDAASAGTVEDVRLVREQLNYAPVQGKRRVFIFDEAHMMSKSAFNALLKSLEEPPAHVMFIMATTEPERLPPTILSRVQHFRFRRLSDGDIAAHLIQVASREGAALSPEAAARIAEFAEGALRDALVLLERCLLNGSDIQLAQVEEVLGLPPETLIGDLAQALATRDLGAALAQGEALYQSGFAARSIIMALARYFRASLFARYRLGQGVELAIPEPVLVRVLQVLEAQAQALTRRDDRFGLEVALLGAYEALSFQEIAKAAVKAEAHEPQLVSAPPSEPVAPAPSLAPKTEPVAGTEVKTVFAEFQKKLKPSQRGFVLEARPTIESGKLVLEFTPKYSFHYQSAQRQLEAMQIVAKELGLGLELRLSDGETEPATELPETGEPEPKESGHPRIADVEKIFGARVEKVEKIPSSE